CMPSRLGNTGASAAALPRERQSACERPGESGASTGHVLALALVGVAMTVLGLTAAVVPPAVPMVAVVMAVTVAAPTPVRPSAQGRVKIPCPGAITPSTSRRTYMRGSTVRFSLLGLAVAC